MLLNILSLGVAIKNEEVKQESQQDENWRYAKILGPHKKSLMSAPKDNQQANVTEENESTPSKQLYTHSHGHVCDRKYCNPIIVSSRGIIKPSHPLTGHSHISNIACERMVTQTEKNWHNHIKNRQT